MRRRRRYQRQLTTRLAWVAGTVFAWSLVGCHSSAGPTSAALFDSVYADYLHGNLALARTRAEVADRLLSSQQSGDAAAWKLKFRFLQAEILSRQSQLDDVVTVLSCDTGAPPLSAEDAIKWKLLCGMAHSKLGQGERGEQELHTAEQLAKSNHSQLMAEVLRAQAIVARDAGKFDESTTGFKASLEALRNGGELLVGAADRVDIGFNYLTEDHFAEALGWSQQAVNFARAIGAHRQLELALGNAGWAQQNLGDFEGALLHFQEAEQKAREIGLNNHRVVWLQNAGLAEYRLGNLDAARKYDEQALAVAKTLPAEKEIDQIANIESNLALLLYERGQYTDAKRYSDAAVAMSGKSKDALVISYSLYTQGLVAARLESDAESERILMSAWKQVPDADVRADIESAIAKLYAGRHQPEQAQQWFKRSVQTFEDKRSKVSDEKLRLSTFAYGQAIYRDYADFLVQTGHSLDALQLLDRSRSRTLEEGLGNQGTATQVAGDPKHVARDLHASILFYSLGREKSYLWVVRAGDIQLITLPSESVIQALVKKHQAQIQEAADPSTDSYDILVKPAAALIPAGSRVFVVADGALHGLNFETLHTPSGYWIEDATITTASSISLLSREKAAAPVRFAKDLLLIGDPTIPRGDFAPLPDAANEIQQVRQHFQPDSETVVSQKAAVPTAYAASNPGDFRYIHFATHGTASRLSPLDSAVVLSPPPIEPEDFKLYARDIVQHPLNATLVTISACYGSGVRNYAGEGLVGLAWVFLRAGAHNVIAALWDVADAASPLLMDQLYSELQAGKAPDEALRAAKLSLLHSSRIYRKPIFWGAFQLYAGS